MDVVNKQKVTSYLKPHNIIAIDACMKNIDIVIIDSPTHSEETIQPN